MTRRVIAVHIAVMCLGCGNVHNDARPIDAAAEDAASVDAPSLGPWGVVSKVDELSTGDARGPSMTTDHLELYFAGVRTGGVGSYDIYKSVRATAQAAWSTPTIVTELSSSASDADPHVASDGLTMWFDTTRDAVQDYDIWVSVRASRNDPWVLRGQ